MDALTTDDPLVLGRYTLLGRPQTTRAQVGLVVQVPDEGDNMIIAAYDRFTVSRP